MGNKDDILAGVGVKKIESKPGGMDITMVDENGVLQGFVNGMYQCFLKAGGVNYCGWTVTHRETGEQFEFIIQKVSGKTPSEMVGELKSKLAAHAAANTELVDDVQIRDKSLELAGKTLAEITGNCPADRTDDVYWDCNEECKPDIEAQCYTRWLIQKAEESLSKAGVK